MRTYYRTLIQAEVVSVGKYHPNAIYNVAQDLEDGPYVGTWSVKEYGVATAKQVEALTLRKQDAEYRHYKHQHSTTIPGIYTEDTSCYKTVIEIEVLTKEEYEVRDLVSLEYDILSGHCLGVWNVKASSSCVVVSGIKNEPELNNTSSTNRYAGPVEIDYWNMDQDNYQDKVAFLTNHNKEELVTAIMRYHYNAFCEDNCDADTLPNVPAGPIGQIPYIGWGWRDIDFCGSVPIGLMSADKQTIIGFIANNKWDYPERYLTDEERMKVISYLDRAMCRISKEARVGILRELWDYMQTLTIY